MTDILPGQVTINKPLVMTLPDMECVMLVDYKPGSRLDQRLTEIERKLDHIFALLVTNGDRT